MYLISKLQMLSYRLLANTKKINQRYDVFQKIFSSQDSTQGFTISRLLNTRSSACLDFTWDAFLSISLHQITLNHICNLYLILSSLTLPT